MSNLKTYQKVNPKEESSSFGISRMEDIYTQRNGQVDDPHRHNFYTVLIVLEAQGFHKIDFNTYELSKGQIFFVAPGQVHQVIEKQKSVGYVMTFSTQFLIQNSISLAFIESLNLFQNYGQSPPLLPAKSRFTIIEKFAENILKLYNSNEQMKNLSIGAYLKLLLIECNNLCSINPIESDAEISGNTLLRKFKEAVENNYKNEHSASFYASSLHISPDHLNRVIKAKIGKTAKEYIESRIIIAAKRLLYFSDLSSKEISFELGFREPANFSAFFKKWTKLSPSNFKKAEKDT